MNSKGLSPIVSDVVLLAVLISIAALASSFFPGITQDLTSNIEQDENYDVILDIKSAQNNMINDTLEVTMINQGEQTGGNVTFTSYCTNDQVSQHIAEPFENKEVRTENFTVPECEIANVVVSANENPAETEYDSVSNIRSEWLQDSGSDFQDIKKSSQDLQTEPNLEIDQNQYTDESSGTFDGAKTDVTVNNSKLILAEP